MNIGNALRDRRSDLSNFLNSACISSQTLADKQTLITLKLELDNATSFEELHAILRRKQKHVQNFLELKKIIEAHTIEPKKWLFFQNSSYVTNLALVKAQIKCSLVFLDIQSKLRLILKEYDTFFAKKPLLRLMQSQDLDLILHEDEIIAFHNANKLLSRQCVLTAYTLADNKIDLIVSLAVDVFNLALKIEDKLHRHMNGEADNDNFRARQLTNLLRVNKLEVEHSSTLSLDDSESSILAHLLFCEEPLEEGPSSEYAEIDTSVKFAYAEIERESKECVENSSQTYDDSSQIYATETIGELSSSSSQEQPEL